LNFISFVVAVVDVIVKIDVVDVHVAIVVIVVFNTDVSVDFVVALMLRFY